MSEALVDSLLMLTVIVSLFSLGTSAIKAIIRATALQGVMLSVLPLLMRGHFELHAFGIGLVSLVLKGVIIPRLLLTAMSRANVIREVEPMIGFGVSLFIGGILVAISFAFGQRLPLPAREGLPVYHLLVPCAFSTLLLGFLLLVSRTKAITQVAGYIVLENGVFLFGLALVRELPFVVELGVLLDVLVGVFIMGIVISQINRTFDHIDTHAMTALKD